MAEVSQRPAPQDVSASNVGDVGPLRDIPSSVDVPTLRAPSPPKASELEPIPSPSPPPTDKPTNPALADRMARFKALQAQKASARKANTAEQLEEEKRNSGIYQQMEKSKDAATRAKYKLLRAEKGENFERERAWEYTIEEDENWAKRTKKRKANADNNAFQDYTAEANKNYKRQLRNMSKMKTEEDGEEYKLAKAEKLRSQVSKGLLTLVENENGDIYTLDEHGRMNTPADENYNCDHKPSKAAVDRLVEDLEKGERARLKARAKRGRENEDDAGDVTYINAKNKQFNDKLARFYNRYTTEIRDNFERGTAI